MLLQSSGIGSMEMLILRWQILVSISRVLMDSIVKLLNKCKPLE